MADDFIHRPDREFQRAYIVAVIRGRLMQQAHDSAEELRQDAIEVTESTLHTALIFALANVRPQSEFYPPELTQDDVEAICQRTVRDYFRKC